MAEERDEVRAVGIGGEGDCTELGDGEKGGED